MIDQILHCTLLWLIAEACSGWSPVSHLIPYGTYCWQLTVIAADIIEW